MAIAIDYEVGDTVYVHYSDTATNYNTYVNVQTRTVSRVDVTASGDVATVYFSDGAQVSDSNATQNVYTTSALCAAAIVTRIIANTTTVVTADTGTTSVASTVSQPSTTLGRVS